MIMMLWDGLAYNPRDEDKMRDTFVREKKFSTVVFAFSLLAGTGLGMLVVIIIELNEILELIK